jgi:hypothetical protein
MAAPTKTQLERVEEPTTLAYRFVDDKLVAHKVVVLPDGIAAALRQSQDAREESKGDWRRDKQNEGECKGE